MAGKVFDFELEYFEKGELKKDLLKIRFVSRKNTRDYEDMMKTIYEVKSIWDDISDKITELAAAETSGEDTELLQMELDQLNEDILIYNDERNIKKRFEIIKRILEDNGITDEKYLSFEFWDENVEPSTELDFVVGCMFKDEDGKKKQSTIKNLMKVGS